MDFRLSGLSSGLDTQAVIDQLMSIERRPINLMLVNQKSAQTVLDRYRALNTKLSALQNSAKALQGAGGSFNLSPFAAKSATSSDATKLTATAEGNATPGTYNVRIQQLALEQKTGGGAFTAPAAAANLTIAGGSAGSKTIAITAGMTADQVASAINGSGAGMNATVVSGRLVLTGKETGEAYTISDDNGGTLVGNLGLNATIQAKQEAQITVDGIAITSKTNSFANAITGVTLNVAGTSPATDIKLTVSQDNTAATDKIKDLVGKFNEIIKQIKEDTKYNAEAKQGGPLIGDSFVNGLQSTLNRMFSEVVDSTATYKNASDVGISIQRDGTLAIDEGKLTKALNTDAAAVFNLFNAEDGATHTTGTQTVKEVNFGVWGSANPADKGDGIATRLWGYVDSLVATASEFNEPDPAGVRARGSLLNRIDSQETSLKNFDKRIDAYEQRLELRERSLRTQFLAMEKAIAMMKNQGNYLSGQFASMGG